MQQHLTLSTALPADHDRAVLIGRAWVEGSGPVLVRVREDGLYDLSHIAATASQLLEMADHPDELLRVSRVWPDRQLPAVLRAMVGPDLSYDETVIWQKQLDRIDYDIRPRVLGGRLRIVATYQLTQAGPGKVHRVYAGSVTADVPMIGGRIERGIVEDMTKSLTLTAACTQESLDRAARLST